MRKSRSDYAIVATICAAEHSTNITCTRLLNVLKFLDFGFLASEGPDGRTFSSLRSFSIERRPTRYDLHVSILQESWNVSPGFGSEKLGWFGVRGGWPPQ